MPSFEVTLIYDAAQSVTIEANSAEEAAEIAESEAEPLSLCHQCSGEVDGGECLGAHVYAAGSMGMLKDTTRAGSLEEAVARLERKVEQLDTANKDWHEKTEWLRKDLQPHELGKHLADVLRERLERKDAASEVVQTVVDTLQDKIDARGPIAKGNLQVYVNMLREVRNA